MAEKDACGATGTLSSQSVSERQQEPEFRLVAVEQRRPTGGVPGGRPDPTLLASNDPVAAVDGEAKPRRLRTDWDERLDATLLPPEASAKRAVIAPDLGEIRAVERAADDGIVELVRQPHALAGDGDVAVLLAEEPPHGAGGDVERARRAAEQEDNPPVVEPRVAIEAVRVLRNAVVGESHHAELLVVASPPNPREVAAVRAQGQRRRAPVEASLLERVEDASIVAEHGDAGAARGDVPVRGRHRVVRERRADPSPFLAGPAGEEASLSSLVGGDRRRRRPPWGFAGQPLSPPPP